MNRTKSYEKIEVGDVITPLHPDELNTLLPDYLKNYWEKFFGYLYLVVYVDEHNETVILRGELLSEKADHFIPFSRIRVVSKKSKLANLLCLKL